MGKDKYGNDWYSQTQENGSQVWVVARNGIIQNGGINIPKREWNNETGYNRLKGVMLK